ncbi:MAG: IS3 family transposase [Actinobacteria bacterium]|nr:IS3 family transposase [Actinomycetota bacterium]
MPAPSRYPEELRDRAVRLVFDMRAETGQRKGPIKKVADQLGINPETLRNWVRRAEVDRRERPGTTSEDADRIKQLEREVRELRRANAILKSASAFFRGGARPPTQLMVDYIDGHREEFGVEPICGVLQFAPSTYYAAKTRPRSDRQISDEELKPELERIWKENYRVYGRRKLWTEAVREGIDVGRDRVERLMKDLGIAGAVRGKTRRTTISDPAAARPADLVDRNWSVESPNRLWVTDLTQVATWAGVVYLCFIIDVYSRMIVGWRAAYHMRTEMVLDALEHAVWTRDDRLDGLIAHSDAGSQFTSIAYTGRLADIGAMPSVGSIGDPIDNAIAESTIGLYKTELIRRQGPWKTIDDVELATLEYIDWFNHRRIHGEIGDVPPIEKETNYYRQSASLTETETKEASLH